jgi:hypothetical protein
MVSADLDFVLEQEGEPALTGRLRGRHNRLVLEVDDAAAFAGGEDAPVIRGLAEALARRGLTLRVEQGERHLVTLGAVHAPWWQRPFTRSRRIRLASLRGAWTSARARAADRDSVLPGASLLPPTTLWPLAPTLRTRPRAARATTHDPARGGAPRLVVTKDSYLPGERQLVIWLHDGLTIGSGDAADVRMPGLQPVHAVLRHDEDDEWVVEAVAGVTRVHGAPVVRQILRTGARVVLGPHHLAFFREEYADHGRPYGGRIGGELGHQRPQPPRPSGASAPDF